MDPNMQILNWYEAVGLLCISIMVVHLTDMGNEKRVSLLHNISFPYLMLLSLSSFSPWMISRCRLCACPIEISSGKHDQVAHSMSGRRRFIFHELIHNTAGFCHHLVPLSIFVWIYGNKIIAYYHI